MLVNHQSSHGQFTRKISHDRKHGQFHDLVEEQPIRTVRVGGSSGSGTRSGVGSRASETSTDDREAKRVSFAESRGQKRQGEEHLDADVAAKCGSTTS